MEVLVFLVPLALLLGLIGLMGFLWSLRNGQTMISRERAGGRLPTMNPWLGNRILKRQ